VSAPDVSFEVLRALGDTTVAADEVEVPIPDLQPEEGAADVFQLRIGLYDLLVERGLASCMDDAERERFLRTALGELLAAEPALRFALSERSRKSEELERAARMRGRQNALTGEWLIPRLEQEIVLYVGRVRALDRTIQGAGR
jgi:hypothetical protein